MNNFDKYTSDHIAIQQLINQYTDIVNHRVWEKLQDIFSEKAVWEALSPINLKWDGLEDIKKKLPESVERLDVLVQSSSGIVINIESADKAYARSLLNETGRNKETK